MPCDMVFRSPVEAAIEMQQGDEDLESQSMDADVIFEQADGGSYLSLDELGFILTRLASLGKMLLNILEIYVCLFKVGCR